MSTLNEREERVLALFNQGKSHSAIGREIGLTKHAVTGVLRVLTDKGLIKARPNPIKQQQLDVEPRKPLARPLRPGEPTLPPLPSLSEPL